ncbi:MAG: hypothetical protein Q9209_003377 [Squamulea sp. 1 TL-2023]
MRRQHYSQTSHIYHFHGLYKAEKGSTLETIEHEVPQRTAQTFIDMAVSNKPLHTSTAIQSTKPSLRQLLDELVTVKLEPSNQIFYIHKGLLCHHSAVFKAMLEHDWKEKQEGLVILKDEDPEPFRRFMLWLYWGKILDDDESISTISSTKLTECYFLADRRDVPAMQNLIIDTIIQKSIAENIIFVGVQSYVWQNTPEQSLLRKLLVEMMALRGNNELTFKDENEKNKYDKSFIVDILRKKHQTPVPISWDEFYKRRCDYHIHNDRVPACSI